MESKTLSLEGKSILVTGGTGSLGEALVRRLLGGELGRPARVVVYSRDEAKQHYMRLRFQRRSTSTDEIIYQQFREVLHFAIGDVRDYSALVPWVRQANFIFNAAALKQVPSCEYFPFEAVLTNVQGPHNLVRAVRECDGSVQAVVGISTDKACKPINVMGMTKALQERILLQAAMDLPNTRMLCVRYGNVIASRGSVVPLFVQQIKDGGPVTVTVPEMTRFLLTLDGAVDTIFDALREGRSGETFVPKLPAAKVVDLARALMDGRDVRIVYTGIRPGEKLHEIMVSEEERFRTVERGAYYVILPLLPELRQEKDLAPVLTAEYSSMDTTLSVEDLRGFLKGAHGEIEDFANA